MIAESEGISLIVKFFLDVYQHKAFEGLGAPEKYVCTTRMRLDPSLEIDFIRFLKLFHHFLKVATFLMLVNLCNRAHLLLDSKWARGIL